MQQNSPTTTSGPSQAVAFSPSSMHGNSVSVTSTVQQSAPINFVPIPTVPLPNTVPPVPGIPRPNAAVPIEPSATVGGALRDSGGVPRQNTVKFENALDFLDQVKLQFANQPKVYNQFLDIMKDFKAQCIDTPGVIARVSELFKGHKNLILGFNTFLPPGYKIEYVPDDQPKEQPIAPLSSVTTAVPVPAQSQQPSVPPHPAAPPVNNQRKVQPEVDHARNYVKKIKMRFTLQPHIYKTFLEILHTYHKEQHTIKDVYEQVAALFQNHQDLLEEFSQFLPDPVTQQQTPAYARQPAQAQPKPAKRSAAAAKMKGEKQDKLAPPAKRRETKSSTSPGDTAEDKLPSGSFEEMNFFFTVKQKLGNPQAYAEFLKCLTLFSQNIISKVELIVLVKDIFGKNRDIYEQFKQIIGFDDTLMDRRQEEKHAAPEIDFKTCKRYGPSYRAPKNYPKPVCSGRTELCNQVLNDTWVSAPTGSEDFGFKNLRKNQYEEMLFKCEDDRFELDLVIELNAATIRALERILKSISEMSEEDSAKFKLETNLDILHVRGIERIYGDKGSEVLDALYNSPAITIPVVLKRLKQKDQEWTKARREWNKIWREVNEKNYYKALDHQSFYFKQNDKKNLSPKVLVAEIKQKYQEALKYRERQRRRQEQMDDAASQATLDGPQPPADSLNEKSEKKEQQAIPESMEIDKPVEQQTNTTATTTTTTTTTSATEVEGKIPQEEDKKSEDVGKEELPPYHLKYAFPDKSLFDIIFSEAGAYADKNLAKQDKEKIDTFIAHFIKVFFVIEDQQSPSNVEDQTMPDAPALSASTPATTTNSRMNQIFFGNTTFYVCFRLLQILYDRLAKAKEFAKQQQTNSQFMFLLNPNKDRKTIDEKDKFQTFLKLLNSLMLGQKEQSVFEDECRALFGVQTYVLFTLDKVIAQLTKQLQALLSEEKCSKLLALHSYECTRGGSEELYHSNIVDLLAEERCFRFEFNQATSELTIQLLDSVHNPPKFVEFSVDKHEKWSQYVENFVGNTEEPNVDPRKHKVFLIRNKKMDDKSKRLENLSIDDNLECRICLTTYRLFYVEHTEDYLYRKGALAKAKKCSMLRQDKEARLQQMIDKLGKK